MQETLAFGLEEFQRMKEFAQNLDDGGEASIKSVKFAGSIGRHPIALIHYG